MGSGLIWCFVIFLLCDGLFGSTVWIACACKELSWSTTIHSSWPLVCSTPSTTQTKLIDTEMAAIGAQKTEMPTLQPKALFNAAGRWETAGDELFRIKDRKQGE